MPDAVGTTITLGSGGFPGLVPILPQVQAHMMDAVLYHSYYSDKISDIQRRAYRSYMHSDDDDDD